MKITQFRAKPFKKEDSVLFGPWLYGDLEHGLNGYLYIRHVVEHKTGKTLKGTRVRPETVGQDSTFIYSKGLICWDGDILSPFHKDYCYWVQFKKGAFHVYHQYGEWGLLQAYIYTCEKYKHEFSSIGNKHDNPELINS